MYNIFNNKRHSLSDKELEPPTKKLLTQGDILIKELSQNQLQKETTLIQQLNYRKEFQSSSYIPITNQLEGVCSLNNFQNVCSDNKKEEAYKSVGLSDEDILLYENYLKGIKHKKISEEVLLEKIKEIENMIHEYDKTKTQTEETTNKLSRHELDEMSAIKPDSIETKLLKFAKNNKERNKILPHPMDNIKQIEETLENDIKLYGPVNINKIRKKARNLANKIENLKVKLPDNKHSTTNSFSKNSKWDIKEPEISLNLSKKVYTCKPQNLYTIKNGEIIKLSDAKSCVQLTEEQIKDIPKFKNYSCGEPSSSLFLKNMHKNISEDELKSILFNHKKDIVSIKLMKGKMIGQGFVEFKDIEAAEKALSTINGVTVKNKPIIAQFGKK